MLLKVLIYGYFRKIYTRRKLNEALRRDIHFMCLSGKQYPNFSMLNSFRSGRLRTGIEEIFRSLLLSMFEESYIRLEEYYCDGTTIQVDANKHKVEWKKNAEHM
jgi:transposase